MFYVEFILVLDGSEIECGKEFVGMKFRFFINMFDSVFCVCNRYRKRKFRFINVLCYLIRISVS